MKRVRPVWLDVTGCGRAEVDVKSTTKQFTYRTPSWTSSIDGLLLDVCHSPVLLSRYSKCLINGFTGCSASA